MSQCQDEMELQNVELPTGTHTEGLAGNMSAPQGHIGFQIKLLGALSVGDVRTGTIPSLLPSQKHYLKVYMSPWYPSLSWPEDCGGKEVPLVGINLRT